MSKAKDPVLRTPSLHALDALEAPDLVLGLFEDVRPLPGTAGLVDWRLGGQLSRFIQSGWLDGTEDELALVPTSCRIGARRLFVLGLGARKRYAKRLVRVRERLPAVLHDAGSEGVALALPGPSRTAGPAIGHLAGELGATLVCIFDEDGKLGDWLQGADAGA